MRSLNLAPIRHAVVVAPHADDETIAAFHTIRALRKRGARVDVIVVTDGAASHRNSRSHPKHRLIALRQAETRRAMGRVGIGPGHIDFLGLPDGGLRDLDARRRSETVRHLQRRPRPDLVIVPSARDDHPDHREVAALCHRAWPRAIPRLTYVVWPSSARMPMHHARKVHVDGAALAKRAALYGYRSQTGLIADDPAGFSLTRGMIHRMCGPRETFAC